MLYVPSVCGESSVVYLVYAVRVVHYRAYQHSVCLSHSLYSFHVSLYTISPHFQLMHILCRYHSEDISQQQSSAYVDPLSCSLESGFVLVP